MKIKFVFSPQFEFGFIDSKKEVALPEFEIKELDTFWKENGENIEKTLKDITGLSFKEEKLLCLLNTKSSISNPIIFLQIENIDDMKDCLIHELIHQLTLQNEYVKTEGWQNLMRMYAKYHFLVKVHIAIHRIHYLLAKKLFPERVERLIHYSTLPRYIKSWDIALSEGDIVDKTLGLHS